MRSCLILSCQLLFCLTSFSYECCGQDSDAVSFHRDIKPIFQANCYGCHQPAKQQGGYEMTDFASMIAGGDSGSPVVISGEPDESYLIEVITPDDDGQAEMPQDKPALASKEIELIRKWIRHGAQDDSPERTTQFSSANPPVYHQLPVITSLDFSPDGKWLAVSGYHEVILLDTDQFKIGHRLIGLSPRIEAVRFSPDGNRIAVAGGTPGLIGEIQVWSTKDASLQLARSVGYDTAFGVSWSPDSKHIAFGLIDNTVRAIRSDTGEQVLFQGAHEDWVRDTVFSMDGSRLVSVGRDTTCKLTDVETERFIDNITSITPAILKGGISSVARHPERDEVVVGCADGIPKVYRMDRQTKRVIGDDANLIRRMPAMRGRIESVDISSDGKRIVAGSSLDGSGSVHVFSYEFDTSLSDQLKKIMAKVVSGRTSAEKKLIEQYVTKDIRVVSSVDIPTSIYATTFSPDGKTIAVAGEDGLIRILEAETGSTKRQFPLIDLQQRTSVAQRNDNWTLKSAERETKPVSITEPKQLKAYPESVKLNAKTDYVQLVLVMDSASGNRYDVTNQVEYSFDSNLVTIDSAGFVQLAAPSQSVDAQFAVTAKFNGQQIEIPISIATEAQWTPDFIRDVNPVLTRVGCNAGACHGSQAGKNGFKLSLRGYDPVYDMRSLKGELASRRINRVAEEYSLMLAKPTGSVPHEGGQLFNRDDKYHQILKEWIAGGAKLNLESPRVSSIEVEPRNPVLQSSGHSQQIRVTATYDDGSTRDVTREAFVESSDLEIVSVEDTRLVALRRGEAPVVARYEGAFIATTVTVMGEREGFVWKQPETNNRIDELVAQKWERMKILPSDLCTDHEFVRRIYLDLTGLPPDADEVRKFVADERETKIKRDELVDRLIGSEDFVEYWTNKWADLLQVNRKYLGVSGSNKFRDWIREQVQNNTPYDQFVSSILTASGSNNENPASSYYKILRTPADTMENTTHLFLGIRFNCNKCHDHPFERWTQDQYYETAAFFAQFKLDQDPASKDKKVGGSAVESAKPLYEIVSDMPEGEITHERTGLEVPPAFPFDCSYESGSDASRRKEFASWLTSPENPYFATSYVNRLWGYLLGTGLIEPLDDIRASNPPTNPELMRFLTDEFLSSNFDMRQLIGLICKSRTYQLSFKTNQFNADDVVNYSHAIPKRLPAEVLFDSIHFVTGSLSMIPGAEPGTRAAMLSDAGARLPSGFLTTLGRPARESACECERSSELQLGSVLALVSGPDVARAISDPKNAIAKIANEFSDDDLLIDELYTRILNRPATSTEIDQAKSAFGLIEDDHSLLIKKLDERKQLVASLIPDLEARRKSDIESTQSELEKAVEEFEPQLAEREKAHQDKIAAAEKSLADYAGDEANMFDTWKRKQLEEIQWQPVQINRFKSAAKRPFTIQSDRTVLLDTSKKGKDTYTIHSKINAAGLTGVRLEVLSDQTLPAYGPGLAPNGNFVLTEFQMEIAHPDRPDEWKQIKIAKARSYFDQSGYPIENVFDGKVGNRAGWATMGRIGVSNWACFAFDVPVGYAGGSLVRFKLHQKYDDEHQIGRFRISVTNYPGPIGLSLSEELAAEIIKPLDSLEEKTRQTVRESFKRDDKKLIALQQAVTKAKKPLDIHPEVKRLREKLLRVSQPLRPDAELQQLEKDLVQSKIQLENRRLTAAQDLAWALINSPSFLFNR